MQQVEEESARLGVVVCLGAARRALAARGRGVGGCPRTAQRMVAMQEVIVRQEAVR